MITDMELQEYLEFLKSDMSSGVMNTDLHIITDPDRIRKFNEDTGKRIGIIYSSSYNRFIVDLVENSKGEIFAYERIVKAAKGNSVVILPRYNEKFVIIKQFRIAAGEFQYAFPRGYGEISLTIEQNAAKEIGEELHAEVLRSEIIGKVIADSGVCGEKVNIVLCDITEPSFSDGYEGIKELYLVTENELCQMIRDGLIVDGFTLSSFSVFKTR